jgi:transposase-like protein
MSEFAEYVGYKDSKVGFEKKINFVSKEVGIPMCEIGHPAKISTIKEQLEPFVCTSCSKFYGRL